ncbi:putative kremen protein 2-like [Apostichopus japonicus]|uniref:Putative kremen protein 2-like n=1 Tax=Stichopus japonicus TaxID=307972 RepID=A0A2G8KJK8_STIJA|nr:putative kremen protein 2-like [Apostichopus japonicus]
MPPRSLEMTLPRPCSDSYRYLGCFKDGDNDTTKVLSKRGSYRPHTDTTKCMEYCLEDSLFYFGIALKYMCYCGNASSNYSRFGPASTPGSVCLDENYNNIEIYEAICFLGDLANGNFTRSYGAASFKCNVGFFLSGNETLTCIKNMKSIVWDGELPQCMAKESYVVSTEREYRLTVSPTESMPINLNDSVEVQTRFSSSSDVTVTIRRLLSSQTTITPREVISTNQATKKTLMSSTNQNTTTTPTTGPGDWPTTNDSQMSTTAEGIIPHIMIAVIPVAVISFFLLLSRCYKYDDPKPKTKSTGESVCGPSSFEYLTPRVVKRQFSSDVPMATYNKSKSMYGSNEDLDNENLIEEDLHGDGDINFDGNYDPDEIVYV